MAIFATTLGLLLGIVCYLAICVTIGYVLYRIEMYKIDKQVRKSLKEDEK